MTGGGAQRLLPPVTVPEMSLLPASALLRGGDLCHPSGAEWCTPHLPRGPRVAVGAAASVSPCVGRPRLSPARLGVPVPGGLASCRGPAWGLVGLCPSRSSRGKRRLLSERWLFCDWRGGGRARLPTPVGRVRGRRRAEHVAGPGAGG